MLVSVVSAAQKDGSAPPAFQQVGISPRTWSETWKLPWPPLAWVHFLFSREFVLSFDRLGPQQSGHCVAKCVAKYVSIIPQCFALFLRTVTGKRNVGEYSSYSQASPSDFVVLHWHCLLFLPALRIILLSKRQLLLPRVMISKLPTNLRTSKMKIPRSFSRQRHVSGPPH